MAANTINPNAKDYDKYDFSGYELTANDKGGYDWTDSSGNKNSLYDEGKGGLIHNVTGADGTSSSYVYTGTRDNDYISRLNKGAKKAYKAQSKAPKTTQPQSNSFTTPVSSGTQVIIMQDENGNNRKVGTTADKNASGLLTGKSIANSFSAIADANVGDFWIDKDNNIHVVTDRDIKYSKGVLEGKYGNGNDNGNGKKYSDDGSDTTSEKDQPRTTNPEEDNKDSDKRIADEVEGTRKLLHDPDNYKDNYQAIIDTAEKRGIAEDLLSGSEGKEKGLYGIIPSFLMGDYGNYHLPKHETYKRYKLRDSITGEVIDDGQGATPAQLKRLNEQIAKDRKERGWTVVESGPVYKVYDPETKEVLRSFSSEDAAIKFRNSKGDKNRLLISESGEPSYNVIDMKGNVIEKFDNEKDAKKYLNGWFELSDEVADEQHVVSYNGKKMVYGTKEEAEKAKKELSKATRGDRAKAWAQFLYRLGDSAYTNAVNNASDFAGEGRPLKSLHSQEMNQRMASNNQLYYKNEEAKNDTVRKLMQLADAGMIDLNNLTNEQMATFIGAIGKEKASQIINTLKKQELDKFMAMEYWNGWTDDQRNALSAWFAQSGQGPQTDSMIALASGKVKAKDFANKWNTQTRLSLAEQGLDIQRLEKVVEDAALKNKMSKAQADVIKELVGEQLRAAKLGNNAKALEMATTSVDSLSKIIDAVVPF
jgi:hypothetical protein